MFFRNKVWIGLACCAAFTALRADVLMFANGDRLEGRYVREDEGVIYFESALLGTIRVNAEDVEIDRSVAVSGKALGSTPLVTVVDEAEMDVEAAVDAVVEAPVVADAEPEVIAPVSDAEAEAERVSLLVRALRWISPFDTWKNKLDLSFLWQNGETDQRDFSVYYTAEALGREIDTRLRAGYEFGVKTGDNDDRVKTTDKTVATFRLRYNYDRITPHKFYLQSDSRYLRDNVKEINHELSQSLGIGWSWDASARFKFSITPSLTAQYSDIAGQDASAYYLLTLFQDIEYTVNSQLKFVQEAEYSYDPQDGRDQGKFFFSGINKITERINLTISYEFNFNRAVAEGIAETSQVIKAGMQTEF